MTEQEKNQDSEESKEFKTRFQEIQQMSVAEKVKLAMRGDKEARSILIKDSNKQIQETVLENPRITETEIVGIANNRMVSEELLRKITGNRQWMKNYQIRLALVNNPKTPLPLSLRLVSSLMVSDLKRLAKSKGVPTALTTTAKRVLSQKGH